MDLKLSTVEFWRAMCNFHFVRLTLRTGKRGNQTVVCDLAPEEIPGFMADKVDRIKEDLK